MKNTREVMPRLRELLVDECDEDLKEEAIALYNEIKETLHSARIDDIQKRFKLVDGARILPAEYDEAIEEGRQGLLVYNAEKYIEILYAEMMEAIQQGALGLYGDDMDAEESAYTYAIEHYEFTVSGDLSPKGPLFSDCSFELLEEGV